MLTTVHRAARASLKHMPETMLRGTTESTVPHIAMRATQQTRTRLAAHTRAVKAAAPSRAPRIEVYLPAAVLLLYVEP